MSHFHRLVTAHVATRDLFRDSTRRNENLVNNIAPRPSAPSACPSQRESLFRSNGTQEETGGPRLSGADFLLLLRSDVSERTRTAVAPAREALTLPDVQQADAVRAVINDPRVADAQRAAQGGAERDLWTRLAPSTGPRHGKHPGRLLFAPSERSRPHSTCAVHQHQAQPQWQ